MAVTEGPDAFRASQLRARDMLRGDLEGAELEKYVEERIITTTLDKAVSWARGNALFPATFGLACIFWFGLLRNRNDDDGRRSR